MLSKIVCWKQITTICKWSRWCPGCQRSFVESKSQLNCWSRWPAWCCQRSFVESKSQRGRGLPERSNVVKDRLLKANHNPCNAEFAPKRLSKIVCWKQITTQHWAIAGGPGLSKIVCWKQITTSDLSLQWDPCCQRSFVESKSQPEVSRLDILRVVKDRLLKANHNPVRLVSLYPFVVKDRLLKANHNNDNRWASKNAVVKDRLLKANHNYGH